MTDCSRVIDAPVHARAEAFLVDSRLSRNVLWNLVGAAAPFLAAAVAVPPIIRSAGAARFGVLQLAWMVAGYFSLFDLGLGRAMTQLVAEQLGKGDGEKIPAVVWTSMALMTALGIFGALVLAAATPWLVGDVLKIPTALKPETLTAFYLLALSLPFVIGATGLRGILEAHSRFDLVNIVRVPLGVMTYLGPLIVLRWSHSLSAMVLSLVVTRFLSWITYLGICLHVYPHLRRRAHLAPHLLRRLLSFSGWMTVSNIVGPLLLYLGRMMIAVLISAEAVAYFSTPYDVVINLLIIPSVFVGVLFPAFTQLFQSDAAGARALYHRSMLYILAAMAPLTILTVIVAKPGLALWINAEFSINGYRVAQLLAVGIFINSFGHLSQAVIQGFGRPDLTAKLHVLELAAYVPYSWWLIKSYGINGAAVAWVIRVTISTAVLSLLANRCFTRSTTNASWKQESA